MPLQPLSQHSCVFGPISVINNVAVAVILLSELHDQRFKGKLLVTLDSCPTSHSQGPCFKEDTSSSQSDCEWGGGASLTELELWAD